MKIGDLVRWTAADVFVTGIIVGTDVKPSRVSTIHRVIIGDLEMFLYSESLEVISASR